MSAFEELLARKLDDPAIRAAFEDSHTRHELIQCLVELRKRAGVTQKELADAMGVKQPAVSGFETEDSDPRLSTLQRYARALGHAIVVDVRPAAHASWVQQARAPERMMKPAQSCYGNSESLLIASKITRSTRTDFALAS